MTIKHVLILGAFNAGAIEKFYLRGFEKCGVRVETYAIADRYYAALNRSIINRVVNKISPDIFYRPINSGLLRFLEGKHFDLILVFKGMELFPETVAQLKNHAAVTANYNGDHPFVYYAPGSGNQHVLNSIPLFDMHISYSRNIVRQLQNRFKVRACCVPFGYNGDVQPSATLETGEYSGRFLFIGAYDQERAAYLNTLKSPFLDIYGDKKWKIRNVFRPYVRGAYRNRALYGDDYSSAIASSTGILNLLRKQNMLEDSHNMRTFEVPGYGGLLISQRTGGQQEYFEEGREAVYFGSVDELKEKLSYLSAKPSVVDSIKKAAYEKCVRGEYSYDHRSKELLQCVSNIS